MSFCTLPNIKTSVLCPKALASVMMAVRPWRDVVHPVLPLPPASRNQALPRVGCMAGATQNHGEGTMAASEPTAAVSRGGAS